MFIQIIFIIVASKPNRIFDLDHEPNANTATINSIPTDMIS